MMVYKYGCKPPKDRAGAVEILRSANRYRNRLVEIKQSETACRAIARLAQSRAYREAIDGAAPNAHYAAAVLGWAIRDVVAPYRRAESAQARKASGLHYGTYMLVEQDVSKAKRFKRFDGSGRIGAPLPTSGKRCLTNNVTGGTDRNLQLHQPAPGFTSKRAPRVIARVRMGKTSWLETVAVIDRPLPQDTTICQAWLQREPIATHDKWSLQLVLAKERKIALAPTKRSVGLDIGWRFTMAGGQQGYGDLRVAADSDERCYEIPQELIRRMRHSRHIESIRANAFNLHKPHPSMLSANRLAARVRAGEFPELENWRAQDRHLRDWMEFEAAGVLQARRELFKLWAIELCERYDTVFIEKFDLRVPARKIRGVKTSEQLREDRARCRAQRFDAAPGLFRSILRAAAAVRGRSVVEVPMPYSNVCSCGWWDRDRSGRMAVSCPNCERRFDGDVNAAQNLLLRGLTGDPLAFQRVAV